MSTLWQPYKVVARFLQPWNFHMGMHWCYNYIIKHMYVYFHDNIENYEKPPLYFHINASVVFIICVYMTQFEKTQLLHTVILDMPILIIWSVVYNYLRKECRYVHACNLTYFYIYENSIFEPALKWIAGCIVHHFS